MAHAGWGGRHPGQFHWGTGQVTKSGSGISRESGQNLYSPTPPRFMFSSCCEITTHAPNTRSQSHSTLALMEHARQRKTITKACYAKGVKKFKVMDALGTLTPTQQRYSDKATALHIAQTHSPQQSASPGEGLHHTGGEDRCGQQGNEGGKNCGWCYPAATRDRRQWTRDGFMGWLLHYGWLSQTTCPVATVRGVAHLQLSIFLK